MSILIKHKEMLFLPLLGKEFEVIPSEGTVWKIANKRRFIPEWIPCVRRRADLPDYCKGYLRVVARINNRSISCPAHRLVWVSVHGRIPDGLTINHKNGIKTDNSIFNLELATTSENTAHAMRHLPRRNYQAGERHSGHKLSDVEVLKMREMRESGSTIPYLASKFGVAQGQVSSICNGKVWKHLGLKKIQMDCHARGENNNKSKLTTESVIAIRKLHSEGVSFKELGRRFGTSDTAIANVVKRKVWAHVP